MTSAPKARRTQRLRELRALQRVTDEVFRSLDLDVVLGGCLDLALEISGASDGAIFLRDDRHAVFVSAYRRGAAPLLAIEPSVAGIVELLETEGSCSIDLQLQSAHSAHAALAYAAGFRKVILLALRTGTELIGFLALGFQEPREISTSLSRTLEAIANYEAIAIENARAHRGAAERARLASVLHEFGARALDVTEESGARELILDTVCRIADADRGLLARRQGDELRIIAAVGKDVPLIGHKESATEGIFATVLDQAAPWLVEDVSTIDPETVIARVARRQQTRSFVLFPLRLRGKSIGVLFAASGVPRRYQPAQVEALQILGSMAAEVLERERLQAEARALQQRLESSIEYLPVHIAVLGPSGATLHANAAARRFASGLGWPPGSDWREALGRFRFFDDHGRELAAAELPLARAFAGERVAPLALLMAAPAGSFRLSVLVMAAPIFDVQGRVQSVVTAFHDISAMREAAQAKDRFISIASHELRSPITSLRASAALLQMDPSAQTSEERRHTLLSRMQRQVARLERLVEQLLESVRLGAASVDLEWDECDLTQLCHEAIDVCASMGGARVQLEAEQPLRGRWDPGRIEQVVINLLTNALRYSAPETPIVLRAYARGARTFIEVSDRGIGIPAEEIDRLLEPFFRASNAAGTHRSGLGLGLHIASEIIRRHQGSLHIESMLGEGSTFTVELPTG